LFLPGPPLQSPPNCPNPFLLFLFFGLSFFYVFSLSLSLLINSWFYCVLSSCRIFPPNPPSVPPTTTSYYPFKTKCGSIWSLSFFQAVDSTPESRTPPPPPAKISLPSLFKTTPPQTFFANYLEDVLVSFPRGPFCVFKI